MYRRLPDFLPVAYGLEALVRPFQHVDGVAALLIGPDVKDRLDLPLPASFEKTTSSVPWYALMRL